MKRLIFCFDGTRNRLSADTPTNVVLTAASIVRQTEQNIPQIIHYDEGVGTARLEYYSGSILGAGLVQNLREAFRFLIFNYDPGDEIFVFGFSRGAYCAQSFVGLIRHTGPLRRLHAARIDDAMEIYRQRLAGGEGSSEQMMRFRAEYSNNVCVSEQDDEWRCANVPNYKTGSLPKLSLKYLGVWDTVGALGVPKIIPFSTRLNRKHAFHNVGLSSFVESARHAVAIDERREFFPPELWGDLTEINRARGYDVDDVRAPYQEKWFPGTHGAVGGGGDIRGLSDGALNWIIKGAKQAGLVLDRDLGSRIHGFKPDALAPLNNISVPEQDITHVLKKARDGPQHIWQLSASTIKRWHAPAEMLPDGKRYRPATLNKVATKLNEHPAGRWYRDQAPVLLTEHMVQHRDELRGLAKHYYGDPNLAGAIYEANRDLMEDPDDLFVGWKLRIPKVEGHPA